MIAAKRVLRYIIFGVLAYPYSITTLTAQDNFKPASFRGLTIGNAKIADLKRVLGKPASEWDNKRGNISIYYKDIGPVPGEVEVAQMRRQR